MNVWQLYKHTSVNKEDYSVNARQCNAHNNTKQPLNMQPYMAAADNILGWLM